MSFSPRTLGNYRLGALLGRGGTGEVFAAEPIAGGAPVAIKLLRSHLASDPAAMAAFQAETERTRAIDHPNVVRVLDAGSDADGFYLVMERLEGETLAARLARGPLPESAARRIGAAIADGLAASHAVGIVHRDLKPGNIVLVDDEPRIVDFGIARYIAGDDPAHTASRIGTPAYMAPEQLTGGVIAPCVDIWALGAVLYELVTGRAAFDATAGKCPQLVEPAPGIVATGVSAAYASLVAACLEREPGRRPASAAEVARVLRGEVVERVTEDVGPSLADRAALGPRVETPRRRTPPIIAVVAVLAIGVVVTAGVGMWWTLGQSPPHAAPAAPSVITVPPPAAAAAVPSSPASASPSPTAPSSVAPAPSPTAAPPARTKVRRPPTHKSPPATAPRAGETLD